MQRAQVVLTKEVLHVSSPQGISSIVALPYRSTPSFSTSLRIAKWQARDPKGEKAGINLYKYCDNNSITEVDDLGLFPSPPFHWHGNYGGPGWSNGGRNSETGPLPMPGEPGYVPPVPGDEEDACYQAHDYCIHNIGRGSCPSSNSHPIRKCDDELHQCLNNMKRKTLGSRFTSWAFSGPIQILAH